jgi:hypothetical protein
MRPVTGGGTVAAYELAPPASGSTDQAPLANPQH